MMRAKTGQVAPVLLLTAGLVSVASLWSQAEPALAKTLTMKAAAEQAIAVSPDLRGSEAQQVLKEGSWVLGFRAFLPKLNLSASENDRLSTIGADSFTKTYTIGLQQMLWDGGRLQASRNLEKAELTISRMDLRRKAAEIGESAINLYRTIIYKEALLEIKNANLTALELQIAILEEEVRRGLALQTDLDEAALSLEDARLSEQSLRLELELARLNLALLLGLQSLPALTERIDTNRATVIPRTSDTSLETQLCQLVAAVHPDLVRARSEIQKLQVQLQHAERDWWPTLKLSGDFSLSGDRYPLSRYSYSLGLSLEFAGPLLSGSVGGKTGWEGTTDRTALVQSSAEPVPDPGSALTKASLQAMLMMEQERYALLLKQTEQQVTRLLKACGMAEDRRLLTQKQSELFWKKLALTEVKHSLGQATTLEVMKARIDYSSQEIAVVEAAVSLLQAERELEKFLDLAPGELGPYIKQLQGSHS
ncbi:TolC family protein [Gracilinema caldarium]|uniref:Outer membrane efflux protein n=1 Tax=Gracilinema caldarium (strain ATCC 51460 / DSM 7334 / H1) TaxID=744872 RepID=F8EXI2_GRAC1|nr:TolC family protein [Gracilinema caldarium]AEJ19209.1 outer membrane efflux protein [Gracilinema caldarium DSM 7334]